jgi:hypothetical protein
MEKIYCPLKLRKYLQKNIPPILNKYFRKVNFTLKFYLLTIIFLIRFIPNVQKTGHKR